MFVQAWEVLRPNPIILQWLKGYKLNFINKFHFIKVPISRQSNFSDRSALIRSINDLQKIGAIIPCQPIKEQFLSPFFLVDKPNGQKRFVLNLKVLKKFIKKDHFKMEDWRTATKLLQKNWFMTTVDLKDAYFLVPIHKASRRFLRFNFNGTLFEFTCMPFGLSSAPYVFTKIIKPVISFLHQQNICVMAYLDDFLIMAESKQVCRESTAVVVNLLCNLGFIINFPKSSLLPQNRCKYLGFIFDSTNLTIELPEDKKLKLIRVIKKLINLKSCRISVFAHVIGLLVSILPTIKYGMLYIKKLEREKLKALKKVNQHYNKIMKVNHLFILDDLNWWLKKDTTSVSKN